MYRIELLCACSQACLSAACFVRVPTPPDSSSPNHVMPLSTVVFAHAAQSCFCSVLRWSSPDHDFQVQLPNGVCWLVVQALPSLPQRPPTHLGQGTFGSVHAAYSPAMGHYVVKSPTQHATASAMDEEAHFLNLFRHPHVVQYLGRVQDSAGGAVPGILMEKLDMDLYDYMQL